MIDYMYIYIYVYVYIISICVLLILKSHEHPGIPWRHLEVVHRSEEEDIAPLSVSGVWRSVAVQLEVQLVYYLHPVYIYVYCIVCITYIYMYMYM